MLSKLFLIAAGAVVVLSTIQTAFEDVGPSAEVPASKAQTEPEAVATQEPVPDRAWNTQVEGHFVRCAITADGRFYIVMPDAEQMQAGVGPMINNEASAWMDVCAPSQPMEGP